MVVKGFDALCDYYRGTEDLETAVVKLDIPNPGTLSMGFDVTADGKIGGHVHYVAERNETSFSVLCPPALVVAWMRERRIPSPFTPLPVCAGDIREEFWDTEQTAVFRIREGSPAWHVLHELGRELYDACRKDPGLLAGGRGKPLPIELPKMDSAIVEGGRIGKTRMSYELCLGFPLYSTAEHVVVDEVIEPH